MQTIDEYITKAHHLVPAPHVLPQLMPLLNRTDIDNSRVVEIISYNPALTASVLRVCNSAYFSRGTSIDNLAHAVTRLGFREIYQIVVAVTGAMTLSCPQKGYGVEAKELWEHSVTTAVAAQVIARDLGEDENIVFTAALLHDLGKIILANAMESLAPQFREEIGKGQSIMDVENKLLGANHAEVGAKLLERWNLPQHLVMAVRFHHHPSEAGTHQRLAACVYLGNFMAYFMGHGYGDHALSLVGRDDALRILKLESEKLPGYMEQCFERLKAVKSMFGIVG